MKQQIQQKLNAIRDIWNNYIFEHDFCSEKILFDKDVKSNFFAEILNYTDDSLPIIYRKKQISYYQEPLANTILFLQTIYIHQDFIEEALRIFKCEKDKGKLKKDENYSINRNIRNELIGHPIRFTLSGKKKLVSSTLFNFHDSNDQVFSYVKYYGEAQEYKLESVNYLYSDVLDRHEKFLIEYLDEILKKCHQKILKPFLKKLQKILDLYFKIPVENLLTIIEHSFSRCFKNCFINDTSSILLLYKKQDLHPRYKTTFEYLWSELELQLKSTINSINEILGKSPIYHIIDKDIPRQKRIGAYEMQKLCDIDTPPHLFQSNYTFLFNQVHATPSIVEELEYLHKTYDMYNSSFLKKNELYIEYYSSYNYLSFLLES